MVNKLIVLTLISLLFLFTKGIAGEFVGLYNIKSLMFVGLGTLLCVFMSLGLTGVKSTLKMVFKRSEKANKLIDKLITYSELFYQSSERVQGRINGEPEGFLKNGLLKVYEGLLSTKEIEQTTRKKIEISFINSEKSAEKIRGMIKYPTIFGLKGTLLALVGYLNHSNQIHLFLGSPSEIIEFGLLSSIYGFFLSYFVILPIAEKMERANDQTVMNQKIMTEGLIHMSKRTNPAIVREILSSYIENDSQGTKDYEYEKA